MKPELEAKPLLTWESDCQMDETNNTRIDTVGVLRVDEVVSRSTIALKSALLAFKSSKRLSIIVRASLPDKNMESGPLSQSGP